MSVSFENPYPKSNPGVEQIERDQDHREKGGILVTMGTGLLIAPVILFTLSMLMKSSVIQVAARERIIAPAVLGATSGVFFLVSLTLISLGACTLHATKPIEAQKLSPLEDQRSNLDIYG